VNPDSFNRSESFNQPVLYGLNLPIVCPLAGVGCGWHDKYLECWLEEGFRRNDLPPPSRGLWISGPDLGADDIKVEHYPGGVFLS